MLKHYQKKYFLNTIKQGQFHAPIFLKPTRSNGSDEVTVPVLYATPREENAPSAKAVSATTRPVMFLIASSSN